MGAHGLVYGCTWNVMGCDGCVIMYVLGDGAEIAGDAFSLLHQVIFRLGPLVGPVAFGLGDHVVQPAQTRPRHPQVFEDFW